MVDHKSMVRKESSMLLFVGKRSAGVGSFVRKPPNKRKRKAESEEEEKVMCVDDKEDNEFKMTHSRAIVSSALDFLVFSWTWPTTDGWRMKIPAATRRRVFESRQICRQWMRALVALRLASGDDL